MAWKINVFKTNYLTLGAYVEDEDTGVTIYLKSCHELGVVHYDRHGYGHAMSECLKCKRKLEQEANKVASVLNLKTEEVEVF